MTIDVIKLNPSYELSIPAIREGLRQFQDPIITEDSVFIVTMVQLID